MKISVVSALLLFMTVFMTAACKKIEINKETETQVRETIENIYKKVLEKIDEISKLGEVTPQMCSENDLWVTDQSYKQEGETHYFIGLSFNRQTAEEAEKKALEYTFARIKKYLSSKSKGNAAVSVESYKIVNFCYDGSDMHYNAAVKIAVPDKEIKRIINDKRSKK